MRLGALSQRIDFFNQNIFVIYAVTLQSKSRAVVCWLQNWSIRPLQHSEKSLQKFIGHWQCVPAAL